MTIKFRVHSMRLEGEGETEKVRVEANSTDPAVNGTVSIVVAPATTIKLGDTLTLT